MSAKLAILFLLLTIAFGLPVLLAFRTADDIQLPGVHTGYQPEQPIPYSHRLHAGVLNIDCQYCHAGVDEGRHATLPSLSVCMNCHNTVAGKTDSAKAGINTLREAWNSGEGVVWKRVHNNPDFVYFNHMAHVRNARQGKGIDCAECHGDMTEAGLGLQAKNLTMGWCVNCHRDENAKYEQEGFAAKAPLDCDACHR